MPRTLIDLYPTQDDFVWDSHLFTAFIGGRGAGKTVAGAVRALALEYLTRPGLGIVVAPTYQMLMDAPWRAALELWAPLVTGINLSDKRMTMQSGHEVLFRSAEDPNKLRGPSASWGWIDEAAMCDAETWPILLGVLRQGGQMGRCWVTTTPKGFNWVHDVFVTAATDDTALYRATTQANVFTDENFKQALVSQYASQFARQELAAEFITLGAGLIKRSWFPVVERAPEGLRWVRYWDLAASSKTSADYTASVRAAEHEGTLYLAGLIRGRWEWPETRRVILQTMAAEADTQQVGIEAVAFQLAAVQEIQQSREAMRTAVRGIGVDRDKLSRALPWVAKAEAGHLRLVAGSAWGEFLAECDQFPEGEHDDTIDAVSGALAMVADVRPTGGIFV